MPATIVDRNIYPKMFNSISNLNTKINILDTNAKFKKNLYYIKKFGLSLSVAQHIDF